MELSKPIEWSEESIKQAIVHFTSTIPKGESRRLFKALYLIFFERVSGTEMAPYLAVLNKEWVLDRLKEAISMSLKSTFFNEFVKEC